MRESKHTLNGVPGLTAFFAENVFRLSDKLLEILQIFTNFEDLGCRNSENSGDLLENGIKIMKIGIKIRILWDLECLIFRSVKCVNTGTPFYSLDFLSRAPEIYKKSVAEYLTDSPIIKAIKARLC